MTSIISQTIARDTGSLRDGPADKSFARRYGPWAVITGASDGIGREFARRVAALGIHPVLVARRRDALERLAAELQREHAVETRVLVADLAEPARVDTVLEATRALDVGLLVTAAGYGTSGPFLSLSRDVELAMIDVNCGAVTAMSHEFAARFAARGKGGLVFLSSLLAFQGVAHAATYAATKAFVQSFAEGLRPELAAKGVDVIATAPGPTRSGFGARADMRMTRTTDPAVVARQTLAALGRRTTVRPGWLSKLLEWSLKPNPRPMRVRILSRIMDAMTRHQAA